MPADEIGAQSWGQLGHPHIIAAVREMPWALRPEKLAIVLDLLRFRAEGERLSAEEIAERIGAARPQTRPAAGAVAVIPIFGVIVQRASMLAQSSGAQGTEQIAAAFRQAVNDPNVGAIVLQIDSPGGGVYGVAELAETIFKARGSKPIVAIADSEAASAAYWIASAADELVVTPSGMVGSIGVWTAHHDFSRAFDGMGIGVSLISAGKFKTEGNPFEPLGEEARVAIQAEVDDYYALFTKAVAKGRSVGVDAVRSGFGEGRMVTAQRAVKLGMADRVETFDQLVARLSGQRSARNTQRAEASAVCSAYVEWTGAPDVCANCFLVRSGHAAIAASDPTPNPSPPVEDSADGPPAVEPGAMTAAGADTDLRRRRLRHEANQRGQP